MHILAINSSGSANHKAVILRIFNTLRDRGVDCLSTDNTKNNALHYAVKCRAEELVSVLLSQGIGLNVVNQDQHSPLSLALQGEKSPILKETQMLHDPIWLKLLKHGANANIVYPEKSLLGVKDGLKIPPLADSSAKNRQKKQRDSGTSNAAESIGPSGPPYKCTVMMKYI